MSSFTEIPYIQPQEVGGDTGTKIT